MHWAQLESETNGLRWTNPAVESQLLLTSFATYFKVAARASQLSDRLESFIHVAKLYCTYIVAMK
jgi:hypothetical protein